MILKGSIRKFAYGPKANSASYVAHLRSLGMAIGDDKVIYAPTKCEIDTTRPWMIEIGHNISITEGVTILAHGYDWSVFKGKRGDVMGSAGHVRIGDNVFSRMNSTILKGVEIDDNVVIGAKSIVTHDTPSNSVAVGDPARSIGDIDDYLEKRRTAQIDEAADLYDCWRRNSSEGRRREIPPREISRSSSGSSRKANRGTCRAMHTSGCSASAAHTIRALCSSRLRRDHLQATRSSSNIWMESSQDGRSRLVML
jgi:acetyltransferase-like isoleucine patch superfamily enzyme